LELQRRHIHARCRSIVREQTWANPISDRSDEGLAGLLVASATSPSRRLIRKELHDRVQAALGQLNVRDRELLVDGAITINKAHLTVRASDTSKLYGAVVLSLTYAITGFVNGETTSVVSGTASLNTPATATSGVGSYPITITAGTLTAANYDFPNL